MTTELVEVETYINMEICTFLILCSATIRFEIPLKNTPKDSYKMGRMSTHKNSIAKSAKNKYKKLYWKYE